MKNYLTYGFLLALAGFLLTLILFLCGLQSDVAKLASTKWIGNVGNLVLGFTLTALGIKACRDKVAASDEFSFGDAFGAGFFIQLFAALFGGGFTYLYLALINPQLTEIAIQGASARFEQRGISGDRLEQMMKLIHWIYRPSILSIAAMILTLIFGTIIALIVAAFLRRDAGEPPVVA